MVGGASEHPLSTAQIDGRFKSGDCHSLTLCADEGLIQPRILQERCDANGECETAVLSGPPSLFIEMIELDVEDGCGPDDCGAAPEASAHGWPRGRWKMIAPSVESYVAPEPVTIDLQAGEEIEVEFVYHKE